MKFFDIASVQYLMATQRVDRAFGVVGGLYAGWLHVHANVHTAEMEEFSADLVAR